MNVMKTGGFISILALSAAMVSGCATSTPQTVSRDDVLYQPSRSGDLQDQPVRDGLTVRIVVDPARIDLGEPFDVEMVIQNAGEQTVRMDSTPDVIVNWVYEDGSRSYTVVRDLLAGEGSTIQLHPGQTIHCKARLDSNRFARTGLVELRALLAFSNHRTNSDLWSGRLLSNGFGMHVREPDRLASRLETVTAANLP